MMHNLASFTDVLCDENNSQPISLPSSTESNVTDIAEASLTRRPPKGAGQQGQFRSVEEIDRKYRGVFTYPFFNLVQSGVLEDALYSDTSMVVCAPTGAGKTVVFEMAIVQLLMELEDKCYDEDFKIIYMAPVKALCTEKLTEWYPKFTKLGLLCIEVTGDTDVDFSQLKPYRLIITTPEKWDMLTRRWRDHKGLVEVIKLFLIDEVHILNDETRGPVLEAVVSRMKTIESSAQSEYRIEQLQKEIQGGNGSKKSPPSIRFVAVSATVSNPEDVAAWLGTAKKPAVFYKFGDECRPVKLKRVVEGYPCPEGTSIFKFDIILNYKLWPVIQKYHDGKPTLIFCNTRKSVIFTAETLSRELTVTFNPEQKAKLTALASTIKNKKLQALVMSGVGCHHAGLLFEERMNIERAFRNRDLPILITTTTLAMGVNLPAHLVIIKNTQQYVNGAYQEYPISTVLQMVGRAGRPQFDTEATAVIMTRAVDKHRYQALVGGREPLQSYLHKRLPENLNSEAALGTVGDVAQCVQWLRSTFLFVRAAKDPKRYLGLPQNSPQRLISKKIEELCVKAMNGLASSGLITMDEASCIESTEAGRLMSIFYLDLETMKLIMKIQGTETLERLLWLICESHELADMHLRVDERRCLNALNRNNTAATIRFPMKGKITTRQMKLNCVIQAILGCLLIPDPSLSQEATKIMRIAERVCKCLVSYVTRPDLITRQPEFYSAVLNTITLAKCIGAHLWENSAYVSRQLKGIGPTFSTLLATAGKVNFMLLEESHPRDLERIMNKGPPAGNVLRKQISLLPKYQLTITPIDEKTVTLQLVLLNQSHLVENMDQLTAGEGHRSHIIVGDSYNHLLLLTSFKDKDLMCVYVGAITYEIRRKHNFEHKIFAHCISSSFVGIDVQSEYLFNDLEHIFRNTIVNPDTQSKKILKQTCITETFKERKRKSNDTSIAQCREKKKRDIDIIEKFKSLKASFGYNTSKEKRSCEPKYAKIDNCLNTDTTVKSNHQTDESLLINLDDVTSDQIVFPVEDNDDYIDDEKIDSIINKIENEISKGMLYSENTIEKSKTLVAREENNLRNSWPASNYDLYTKPDRDLSTRRKRKPVPTKSNYNFIELLEKNTDLYENDNAATTSTDSLKHNGFSETIKNHINQYLQETTISTTTSNRNIEVLLDDPEKLQKENAPHVVETVNMNTICDSHEPIIEYESKEIQGVNYTKETDNTIKKPNTVDDATEVKTIGIVNLKETKSPKTDVSYYQIKGNAAFEHDAHICVKDITESNIETKKNIQVNNLYHSDNKFPEYESQKLVEVYEPENNMDGDNCLNGQIKIEDIMNKSQSTSECFTNKQIMETVRFTSDDAKYNGTTKNLQNINCTDNTLKLSSTLVPYNNSKGMTSCNITRTNKNSVSERSESPLFKGSTVNNGAENCLNIVPSINSDPIVNGTNTLNLHDNVNLRPNKISQGITMPIPRNNTQTENRIDITSKVSNIMHKDEYVNQYSYSTTTVDVCTKILPDHSINVIRKVKMDFNITEIIARMNNDFKSTCYVQENDNTGEEFNNVESKPLRYVQGSKHHMATEQNMLELLNKNRIPDNSFNLLQNKGPVIAKDITENSNTASEGFEDIINERKQTIISNSQKRNNSNVIEKIGGCTNINFASDTEDTNKQAEPSCVGDKIKNILQKYGKILGTDKPKRDITKDNIIAIRPTVTTSPIVKRNRPFKIGDIHKHHVSLPNTLVNDITADSIVSMSDVKEEEIVDDKKEMLYFENEKRFSNNDQEVNPNLEREISNVFLETVHEPIVSEIDFESNINLDLDQSMLDPKTLLQCVVNEEEEILPPPPQFRDVDDLSSEFNNVFTDGDSWRTDDDKYNETIFDDDTATELTPSKEIETWNLSREDSWDNTHSIDINSPKSFTMIRKNNLGESLLEDTSMPRRARLGKFKFNHKDKLNIRK